VKFLIAMCTSADELVIDLKTAKALDIAIPAPLLTLHIVAHDHRS
jgi:hypothetical protein